MPLLSHKDTQWATHRNKAWLPPTEQLGRVPGAARAAGRSASAAVGEGVLCARVLSAGPGLGRASVGWARGAAEGPGLNPRPRCVFLNREGEKDS